ncbi:MAG: DUF4038 domain-containing protein, partial [Acidimicrobiia bacterium]|nr:DUF4038 domain-containing protein [Acidimicrobiia bacterium]
MLATVVLPPVPAEAAPTLIDRSAWSIVSGQTTEDDGNGPDNAIDGDTQSFWHTRWQSPAAPFPHDLVINLGATHDIEGFRYLPRQWGQNGEIKDYELYLSSNGSSWGSPVASGQFPDDPSRAEQEVPFASTSASWVRLRSLSSWHGAFTSVAEFNLLSDGGGGTNPPDLEVTGVRGTIIDWGPGSGSSCSIVAGSGTPAGSAGLATVAPSCGTGTFNATGLSPGLYQFDFNRDASVLTVSITVRDPIPMWDTAWSLPNRSTPAHVDDYVDYLQAEGFEGMWISIAPFNWQGGMNATNYAGHSLGSFSSPNPNYLAHVDYIIDEAAAHGLNVGVVVAWGTDYTGIHPGTWPDSNTFGPATDRFESCHPDPYSKISSSRQAALPAGYFTSCDPNNASDSRNQKAYNYGFTLGDRWKSESNVLWVMGGDYWDGTSEDLTEHTWIKIVDGLRAAGATQDVTYQPGGYSSSWNNFAGDAWVDQVSFNHHCLQAPQLEVELAALDVYGKPVIASEVRYEDEWADANGLTWWCQGGSPGGNTIGAAEIIADAQAVLDSGADHYVYGHDERWSWDTNDEDNDGVIDALDSLGRPGEQAALDLLGANVPDPPAPGADPWPPTWPVGSTFAVTDLTLTAATLDWSAAVDNIGVAGYRLYDASNTLLDTVIGATSTTLTGLPPNTAQTIRVEAYDAEGNESQPLAGLVMGARVDLPAGDRPHSIDLADLDGDGDADLVAAAAGSDSAAVLLGTGSGTFNPVTLYPVGPAGEFPKNIDVADLDDNGTPDLVAANQNQNRFGVLLGDGDGTFAAPSVYDTRVGTHDVVTGDFDNDTELDVAAVGWGDSMIATWQGTGTGAFTNRADFEAGGTPHAVVAADFDDNGTIDLAVASHSLSAVRVLSGTGTGSFAAPVNYPVTGSAHSIALADFNGDGDEDLVTADESADNVSVLLGSAGTTFSAGTAFAVGDQPKGVAAGDLDGDGNADIVAASIRGNYPNLVNPGGDPLTVWLGNGDGTFAAGPTLTAGEAPFATAIGDVNGDGHADLLAANWHNDSVSVFLNLGRGGPATSFTTTDTQFNVVPELTGLTFPTNVEFAPDGRIFVAEKAGVLKAFDGFGDATPTTVFDISSSVNDSLDRGLLGLAIHPDFPATPYVYTFYTSNELLPGTSGSDTVSNKLSRWEVDLSNNLVGTEQVLIHDWCQTANTHSAGDLEFGLDGYLYASAGEAGDPGIADWGQTNNGCADPPNEGGAVRSQDVLTSVGGEVADPVNLDGSIIRVDPLTGAPSPGNPLVGGTIAGDDPIIAHGLRNPFRFVVRPTGGELYVGDVGSSAWEKINVVADPADAVVENFRWPCWEGPDVNGGFIGNPLCDDLVAGTGSWAVTTTPTPAFFEYGHPTSLLSCAPAGSSVSGLAFEIDSNYGADYDDALFFADYTRGCLFAMKAGPGGAPDPAQLELVLQGEQVVDLESGPGGDIFLVDLLAGRVSRLDFQGVNGIPAAHLTADVITGEAPLTVAFDGTGSTDPDGDPLTHQWDWNGDLVFDAVGATPSHTFTTPGTHRVILRVTDPSGASNDATLTVNSGNTPPVPTIAEPLGSFEWIVGDTIPFSGSAVDAEDGAIDPVDLDWTVRLHHCPGGICHIHIETTIDGTAGGNHPADDHAYPSWLEFELTATDSTGATATTSVLVYPRTSTITLETNPPGLDLVAGITPTQQPSPIVIEAIENGQVTVNAIGPQTHNGLDFDFVSWSDGGSRNHLVTVPADDGT